MLLKSLRSLRVVYDYKNIQLVKCPLLKSPSVSDVSVVEMYTDDTSLTYDIIRHFY